MSATGPFFSEAWPSSLSARTSNSTEIQRPDRCHMRCNSITTNRLLEESEMIELLISVAGLGLLLVWVNWCGGRCVEAIFRGAQLDEVYSEIQWTGKKGANPEGIKTWFFTGG